MKNYSLNEQLNLIHSKLKKVESLIDLFNSDTSYIEDISLVKFISYLYKKQIRFCVVESTFIKDFNLFENQIYHLKGQVLNDIDISKYIITRNDLDSTEYFYDNSILKTFYLNRKTINHWSFCIFTERNTFYFMKRKNKTFIFKL